MSIKTNFGTIYMMNSLKLSCHKVFYKTKISIFSKNKCCLLFSLNLQTEKKTHSFSRHFLQRICLWDFWLYNMNEFISLYNFSFIFICFYSHFSSFCECNKSFCLEARARAWVQDRGKDLAVVLMGST